jgi:hypothetical protein
LPGVRDTPVPTTRALVVFALVLILPAPQARTQSTPVASVTSPLEQWGSSVGDDYFLATYTQLEEYWKTLDRESDRMRLVDIGRTEEGRAQWMAIVSAPENLARLDRYQSIARRLALADGVTEDEARQLAAEGKAIVWIDGGLHANEVLGAQQLIETVYRLVSGTDPETMRFLRDVIVLAVHANPDGHELVASWYMREPNPRRRTLDGVPRPYQKYVGHDNNRDFYLASQAETINMSRVMYREWFPQIVYNHHQAAPAGTVMFAPPFRDPFNYVFDPLIPAGINLVGAAMHSRFAAEGKRGVTMREGSNYSTWWNGGLRTTAYFHNQIGLLTEAIGSPTPIDIPFVPERQLPSGDLPLPIAPQRWHFRQSIEYSLTANRAVLDVASRYRETLLLNAYLMGRNAIQKGSEDTWTISPRRLEQVRASLGGRGPAAEASFARLLRDPAHRDPRGYILPANQPDFLTATKFVDALLKAGIVVHRATAPFVAGGRSYPAGSYVVLTAQAFRPHVLDMFEPQDHPDDTQYPGGPPIPPYDGAGWTLAFQMGIEFDRVLDAFTGPFEAVDDASPPQGRVDGGSDPAGYLLPHHPNDAFIAVNRLLKAGEAVYWPTDRRIGGTEGTGSMYVAARPGTAAILEHAARDLGLTFTGTQMTPPADAIRLQPVRVALWDRYGGASSSGWTRWLLERFEFPFELVYPQAIDGGALARYDVLILTDEAALLSDNRGSGDGAPPEERLPPEYRGTTGALTRERSLPRLREFVERGGTLIAIGDATEIARALGVRVDDALVDATGRPLRREAYYVPGSVLRVRVDNTTPLGFGFKPQVDVYFDNSPVFRIAGASARPRGAGSAPRAVAWFDRPDPLRSGWALGERYLNGAIAVVDAPLGRGRVLLFGPEVNFRAQSHGTFKFLFNGIYYGKAVAGSGGGGTGD